MIKKLVIAIAIFVLKIGPALSYTQTYKLNQQQNSNQYLQETVFYNTQSHKFHKMSCIWATRCTKNCIPITRGEALQIGIPCKVCGG